MTDIAAALDALVPGADWQGSVTANTEEAYAALRWSDARPKPSWLDVVAKATEIATAPPPDPVTTLLTMTEVEALFLVAGVSQAAIDAIKRARP